MKTKLLGVLAFVSLLGLSPARAVTMYTYNVNYNISLTPVTGDIVLNCPSAFPCDVSSTSLVSWSFTINGVTMSGTSATFVTPYDLIAYPDNSIWFIPQTSGTIFEDPGVGAVCFDVETGQCADVGGPSFGVFFQTTDTDITSLSTQDIPQVIATITPLPAALPLFGAVFGLGGLLGWRRKRKNAGVIAAA
jgi:hypothetical protein